jgi:tRNA C32,U32 (ribose-2'-O)-methylase TrmJ
MEHLFTHLEETLIQVEFHDPQNPRQLMNRLRRMFSRIRMDQMEVTSMRGFLTSVNKLHAGKSDKSAVVKNRNGE